MGDYEAAM